MTSYTITVAPNDNSGNTTTLTVDTSGDEIRITDVHLHAGGGLSGGQMPSVDFDLLLRAVAASPTPRTLDTAPDTVRTVPEPVPIDEDVDTTPAPATGRAPRSRRRAATATPEPAGAPPARRGRAGTAKAAAPKAAAPKTAAPKTATPKAAAPKTATPKAATPKTATTVKKVAKRTKATASGERMYRRMPDDFAAVHEQNDSAAALAEHYHVPRYTVHGWIRRIRATSPPAAR